MNDLFIQIFMLPINFSYCCDNFLLKKNFNRATAFTYKFVGYNRRKLFNYHVCRTVRIKDAEKERK